MFLSPMPFRVTLGRWTVDGLCPSIYAWLRLTGSCPDEPHVTDEAVAFLFGASLGFPPCSQPSIRQVKRRCPEQPIFMYDRKH